MSHDKQLYSRFCITQSNDAHCISHRRGMARRCRRNAHKRYRQLLKRMDRLHV